jgi:RNA polymerase sigma-70 factor (ECF subfamily)
MPFLRNISSDLSDDDLLSRYRSHTDLEALGILYSRYMDLVYGVCLKYLKDPEKSKDAVLDIFEELVSKLRKHEVANFRHWLYPVAKNHCLMQLRSNKKEGNIVKIELSGVQSEESGHLNGVLEKEENFQKLQYCLDQLGTEQKTVIEMFYLKGICYNEIATKTGLDWKQVRSFIQNGRRNLKVCMDKQTINPLHISGK